MAATTQIWTNHAGSSGNPNTADVTSSSIRFKHADNSTGDASNPMVRPSAGNYDRSYIKFLNLQITGGTFNAVTNGRFYVGGQLATGQVFYAISDATTYTVQAADATSGNDSTFTSNPSSGSPITFYSGAGVTTTGRVGYYVRVYMRAADNIPAPGTLSPPATFTFAYDET